MFCGSIKVFKEHKLGFHGIINQILIWSCCHHPSLALKRKSEGQDFTDCYLHGPLLCVWVFDSENDGWSLKIV